MSIRYRYSLLFMPFLFWVLAGCNSYKLSEVKSVRIILSENPTPVMQNIANLFSQRVQERSGTKISASGDAELNIELLIKPGIGTEGFTIADDKNGNIQITGNDQRGVLYGIGKFLRTSIFSKTGFTPGKWRGTSVPEKLVRGMYLANHFDNFYQAASVEEVERYIEDLALWGINNLLFVRASDEISGNRLKQFMLKAKSLEMSIGFLVEGNEGFTSSPVELRCDPKGGRGAIDPSYICPSKPGGLDYILKLFTENFEKSCNVQPDFICIWPYDAGGCGCSDCKPWGSNGYIKCAKGISKIAKEKFPDVKIILSTWYFDSTEWKGLSDQLAHDHSWVDMVMAEDIPGYQISNLPPLEGNLSTIGFPEISMHETFPWGGFGATPLPNHLLGQWKKVSDRFSGGFPYSEGIFDDISKFTYSQLYWNPKLTTEEILAEYIAWEYAPEVVPDILKVIATLEQNHHMRWWPGELEGVKLIMNWFPSKDSKPQADPGAEEAYSIVKQVDAKLPEWAQKSWRWRLVFIRTMLDAELKANGGSPNDVCIKGFKELMKIYHVTINTDPVVKPPIPGTGE